MHPSKSVLFSASIGIIVAISIIAMTTIVPPVNPLTSLSSKLSSTSMTSSSTQPTTSKSTESTTSAYTGPTGSLSVLLTDPPNVPQGVTDVYMSYSSVSAHIATEGNQSQFWTLLSKDGEIDLMQLVNVSQTIGLKSSIPAGTSFDSIALNITSVVVAYNGSNYNATLIPNEQEFIIPISEGVQVNASQTPTAVLIDMSPKVLLLGTSPPSFGFLPSNSALIVPSNSVPVQALKVGEKHDLDQDSWWKTLVAETHFSIITAVLSKNQSLFQLNVSNTGNVSITFRFVTITPGPFLLGEGASVPPFVTSAVFSVLPNATLQPLSGTNKQQILSEIGSSGYVLGPQASITLSYTGPIVFGLIQYSGPQSNPTENLSVGPYMIRLFGNANVAFRPINVSS
jgi:hypothetical protein